MLYPPSASRNQGQCRHLVAPLFLGSAARTRVVTAPLICAVSTFETQQPGTPRRSLRFRWQRESSAAEWSWQEKRKRALLESIPPGISCRRLIPMSAGASVFGLIPRLSITALFPVPACTPVLNAIGIDLLMPPKTQSCD